MNRFRLPSFSAALALAGAGLLSLASAAPPEEGFDEKLYRNGLALVQAGQTDHALRTFKELLDGYPTSPRADDALFRSGDLFYSNDAIDGLHRAEADPIARALPFFERIQAEYPRSDNAAAALHRLALLALEGRNPKRSPVEAYARFSRLLALYPESPLVDRALLGAANAQMQLGDCGLALFHLDRLFERFPGSPAADAGRFL
ncbi:MAG: tetratricopeptide repeat protein, partial [Acidobacteria bacterium]|nr:tetratricopeptide repeat protein [Acidobacteriota bacterium]